MWIILAGCAWRDIPWGDDGDPVTAPVVADRNAGMDATLSIEVRPRAEREEDLLIALGAAEFEYGFANLSLVRQTLDVDADRISALRESLARAYEPDAGEAGREDLAVLWDEGRRDLAAVVERVRVDTLALSGGTYIVSLPTAVNAGTNAVALPLPDLGIESLGLDPETRLASRGGVLVADRALAGAAEKIDADMVRTDDAERSLETALAAAATTIAVVTRPCHGDIAVELAYARARVGVEAARRLDALGVEIDARLATLAGLASSAETGDAGGEFDSILLEIGELATAVTLDGRPLATGDGSSWSAVLPASIEASGIVGTTIVPPNWTPGGLDLIGLSFDTPEATSRAEEAIREGRSRLAAGRAEVATALDVLERAVAMAQERCPSQ